MHMRTDRLKWADAILTGEVLKGWHIYPLQLDDLSNISYSKGPVSRPDLARFDAEGSALLAAMARFAVLPSRAASGQPAAASGQLRAPSAAEVGPTFYRWAARNVFCHDLELLVVSPCPFTRPQLSRNHVLLEAALTS